MMTISRFAKWLGQQRCKSFYRILGFDTVTYDLVIGELTESYNKIVEKTMVFSPIGQTAM